MAHHCIVVGHVRSDDEDQDTGRVCIRRRHGRALCHGRTGRERGVVRFQFGLRGDRGSPVRGDCRTGTQRRGTLDGKADAGNTVVLHDRHHTDDGAGGSAQFVPQQHHRGGTLSESGEGVGQEALHRPVQAPHPAELRLVSGRYLYPHRYASQPDYLGHVDERHAGGAEHVFHHHPRPLLSGSRCGHHPVDQASVAGTQVVGRGI